MKNRAFFNGAIILVIFNLVGKVIGSVYRISLATVLGGTGMGQYQLVFPLYCLILTISTSGIPVAISKMVAEFNEQNRFKSSKKLLGISILILSLISLVGAAVIVFGAKFISGFQGNPNAYVCYYGIAPAVVFVGVLSAFRGYFQGNLQMFPTAISGLIEQSLKLGFGLFLSRSFLKFGTEYAVFGALLGISVSELFAFLFLLFCFIFKKKKKDMAIETSSYSAKFLSRSLISLSVPVTLGGLISPIVSMVDSFLVVNLLMAAGFSSHRATALLGVQAGVVEPLVNLPVTIAVSLAVVLLPSISKLKVSGEKEQVKNLISKAIEITLSVSVCCMVCYVIFGSQMLEFLYGRSFDMEELLTATKLLFIASFNIIFLSLVQISASVLQGLGHPKYTVKSLFIGCAIKVALETILLLTPGVGIIGTVMSGGACYFIVLILNFRKIKKITGIKLFEGYFFVSIQAAAIAAVAFGLNYLFKDLFSGVVSLFISGSAAVIIFLVTYYMFFIREPKRKAVYESHEF